MCNWDEVLDILPPAQCIIIQNKLFDMSAMVVATDETEKAEAPVHINVTDLTFGYVGREVELFFQIY